MEGSTITAFANFEGETDASGRKHGWGKLTWDDGDCFEGEFRDDEKVSGTFRWSTGDSYEGQWQQDLMHGRGRYDYADGRSYLGHWEKGYRHGHGTFRWPNGDRYDGEFVHDMCHGVGVHTYADGKQYKGEWKDNKKHGYGVMYWPKGSRTEGIWEHNLLTGCTLFTEAEGNRYEEKWKDGARDGPRKPLKRSDEEILSVLRSTEPLKWANDSDFAACYKCDEAFTFLLRRHHCRLCGLVFCEKCSLRTLMLPQLSTTKPQRVCDECFLLKKTSEVMALIDALPAPPQETSLPLHHQQTASQDDQVQAELDD